MFDFNWLQTNPNTPTLYTALITLLLSITLSICIAITYEFTTRNVPKNGNFLQALTLISSIAAIVMLAVGDSLAVGLGMLGALSIIRFRTTLNDPRNITFMFASLAVGISCGVLGYSIAISGTIIFCLIAIAMYYSQWGATDSLIGIARIVFDNRQAEVSDIEKFMAVYCNFIELVAVRPFNNRAVKKKNRGHYEEIVFHLQLKNGVSKSQFLAQVDENDQIHRIKYAVEKLNYRL